MIGTLLLRGVAIAIAVAAMLDPGIAVARRQLPVVTLAVLDPPEAACEEGTSDSACTSEAWQAAERLRAAMAPSLSPVSRGVPPHGRAAACPPALPCVLVGGRASDGPLLGDGAALVGVLRIPSTEPSRLRITSVEMAHEQHPLAAGTLRVHLAGLADERAVRIDVVDDEAIVGGAEIAASGRGDTIADVPWWPIAAGPRRLSIRAWPATAATTAADDPKDGEQPVETATVVDVGVDVKALPREVLVHEARPSWASAFVRRALENDPRFHVRARSRLGPELSVSLEQPPRLEGAALASSSVIVVGAPEQLSVREVEVLERFVRMRGGSAILVPDRLLSGPITRLAPKGLRERLERDPIAVGALRAGELLVAPAAAPWRSIAAAPDGAAVIVSRGSGEGRIIVAGAMDAWRYRASDEARFDTFWRSLVSEAAEAAGRPLEVHASPALARPGQDVHIDLVRRSMDERIVNSTASAEVVCGDARAEPIRLWPSGRSRFTGVFTAGAAGVCRVRASARAPAAEEEATADFLVADHVSSPGLGPGARRIEALAAAYGAPVVDAGGEEGLARQIQGRMPPELARATVSPMRSPWWIVPFIACLGGEWWLRRRRGKR